MDAKKPKLSAAEKAKARELIQRRLRNERDGITKFLRRLDLLAEVNGEKWAQAQRAHYESRLNTIAAILTKMR